MAPSSPLAMTHQIGRKAGASLLHAARSAEALGRPFNRIVTIHLGQLGSTYETVFHDFAELRGNWFRRWSTYEPVGYPKNGPPTYCYVHENENGLPHTHWMVHVHPDNWARFERQLTRWLVKRFGLRALPAGALQVKAVYNAEGLKLYMAKNLDPHLARLWRIDWEEGGPIAFRRADVSRNLGPSFWRRQKAKYFASQHQHAAPTSAPSPVAPQPSAAPPRATIVPAPVILLDEIMVTGPLPPVPLPPLGARCSPPPS